MNSNSKLLLDIGIVTAVWDGYGKYLDNWLRAIALSTVWPAQVTIILGDNHGVDNVAGLIDRFSELPLVVKRSRVQTVMGPMRNAAIELTPTKWIMYLSADDLLLPDGLKAISPKVYRSDYISIGWWSCKTWYPNGKFTRHHPVVPREMAGLKKQRGFIIGHSPFRRKFWEKNKYMDHDYPNAPFVADMVEAGARFTKVDEAVTMYVRRQDSHAARLGRRRAAGNPDEIAKAVHWKKDFEQRIDKYYGGVK